MSNQSIETTNVVMDDVLAEDDFIGGPTTILLFGGITDDMCAQAINDIICEQYEPNPHNLIRILINSEGGDLASTFALIEVMRASKVPIETIALGQCASAGLILLMSGTPGLRKITPTCASMTHNYNAEIGGSHWDLEALHLELKNTHERVLQHYMTCTGLSKNVVIKQLIGKTDRYLLPDEVVKFNIADKVGRLEF